jgi:IS30 family transposase
MEKPGLGHRLSDVEQGIIWSRWREGDSIADIARRLLRGNGTVWHFVRAHGGFSPPLRSRRSTELTLEEREEISRGLSMDRSLRAIAKHLKRQPSTIFREVVRNGGRRRYRAVLAEEAAARRALRPKACKLGRSPDLRRVVSEKLLEDWSPEQISGWLPLGFPDDEEMRISHESIYKTLFVQTRGALKRELQSHLRTKRVMRQARTSTRRRKNVGQIPNAVSIRERPAEADDRAVPGHWEGDLIVGAGHTYMATLVERHSRFTMLVALPSKETETVVKALAAKIQELPAELRRSLTWDRGLEMAAHADFTIATDVEVYFCDPRSPWQRGTNENTNGLLRQYFPGTASLTDFTQGELDRVARQLNQRPRKTLNFQTPAQTLSLALQ